MAAGLFDVLNDMFTGRDLSQRYSDQDLKNLGFSVQRIMSIKYPMQAQSQNVLGVNMLAVVRYWEVNMKGKYTQTPPWAFTSTAKERKAHQAKVGLIEMPDKEVVDAFMEFHGLDKHEMAFLAKSKTNEMKLMLEEFEGQFKLRKN